MNVIDKIREKGLSGYLKSVKYRIIRLYNNILFKKYERIPIDERSIVLESEGDCCDNAYALFDYMKHNGYVGKYKITWLVDHPENFKDEDNVKYVRKNINENFSVETVKALRTCKWYIYDHCNLYYSNQLYPSKGTHVIFLSHGCTYKGNKGGKIDDIGFMPEKMFITGDHFIKPMSAWATVPEDRIISLGYPRNDFLLHTGEAKTRNIKELFKIDIFDKIYLWMPTFRQSDSVSINEDYIDNETGLPLICTHDELDELNGFLNIRNAVLLLKVHHLQAQLPVFKSKWTNIKIVLDKDIEEKKCQLYHLVVVSDCLITDYSSIYNDYLLMDKPVIFTLDDYEEYKKSRGLYPIDIKKTMKGHHVYNLLDLFLAIDDISQNKDPYKEARNEWKSICHKYITGYSSERILNYLKIDV